MIIENRKITKKELSYILSVSLKTAYKEYDILLDCLNLERPFLTESDLIKLEILQKREKTSKKE